ncbi:MAG: hypothetical protein EZS26_002484 [Candidatus Ordinivivax streblomastigis]|jgi:putative transposase|uniref:Transposase IS200-like domain-containing protein n=1 Tax=Candidatus Ordinivivax streblomastigis TaxID=2540710 RepID=A0A5M8NZ23_9BACT|nr:MAG: hypothetical protein EZS26_002484 [Candidatus Ordinivivax streblomastigis]MDR2843730.1 transposase [Candidatus Symbiothrix sp.]
MSYVRIWVHVVFSIKRRYFKTLEMPGMDILREHIRSQCTRKEIYLDSVNGYLDHLHLLISLGKQQSIADVVHSIKGEASFWANKQQLFRHKLQWQDDYWAVSVSESQVSRVRNYIVLQQRHHQRKTFADEETEFLEKYGWTKIQDKNENI